MMQVTLLIAALLLPHGAPSPAMAQDEEAPAAAWSPWGAGVPRLGDTRFISTTFLPDPFIRTVLRNKLGYGGASDLKLTLLEDDEGEPILGLEGDVLYALLGLRYQHAVQDWLAVWVSARLSARLGNELQSLLAQGVSLFTGFELGWLVRVYETDRHIVSTSVSLGNSSSTIVDIYGFVNRIIEDGGLEPDNQLVRDVPRLDGALDLRYAFAASDMVGIQANGMAVYGETVERRAGNQWSYVLGAVLHLDLHARTQLPLGFALGYKHMTAPDPVDGDRAGIHSFLLNTSYTGRDDFTFGIDLQYERVPLLRFDEDASVFTLLASLWYYF
jgi:hypothetical protein